jgi:hypothetical protein
MGNATPARAADPVCAFLQSGLRFADPVTLVFQPLPDHFVVLIEGRDQRLVEQVNGTRLSLVGRFGSPSSDQRRHAPTQRTFLTEEFIERQAMRGHGVLLPERPIASALGMVYRIPRRRRMASRERTRHSNTPDRPCGMPSRSPIRRSLNTSGIRPSRS